VANQNFRVKKGLEVGLGGTSLFVDDTGVGINSTTPRGDLDVRGDAYIEDLRVGPSTAGIGSTALFVDGGTYIDGDVLITGDIIFDDAILDDLVVTGISSLNELTFNVGIGSTLTLQYLNVTESAKINGAGIATIGGDPIFETIEVTDYSIFGGLNTTGFSTFYQNLDIKEDLSVGGNIVLEDLNAGNITVGGTVFTNGLDFNVGIGTTLTLQFLKVTDSAEINGAGIATIGGDPVFNSLSVTGFSTFGGLNTTGFSTFYQNLRVDKDLQVGGDISLDDLTSGNISVGGTVTTNGLIFNVGIGTTAILENLIVTGISSLQTITGFGSELQYLPAGSISTSVGIGSTIPPTLRPTGEPIQAGDLWFDAQDLRQYTYYVDPNGDAQWVDSNPPPTQPALRFSGDDGQIGEVDLQLAVFDIVGKKNQVLTDAVGAGTSLIVGLSTNVSIDGSLSVGTTASFGGSVSIGDTLFVTDNVVIGGGITFQGDVTIEIDVEVEGNINQSPSGIATFGELNFNVGFGNSLTVDDLFVTGTIEADGAGIATIGGSPVFENLTVTGITTLGFTTVQGNLNVTGDLIVGDDIVFDEATLRNINVSGLASLNQLTYNVGTAQTLTIQQRLFVDNAPTDLNGDLRVGGASTFIGIATFNDRAFFGGTVDINGDLIADDASFVDLTVSESLISSDIFTYNVGTGNTFTATRDLKAPGNLTATIAGITTLGVSSTLEVSGVSSFIGDLNFTNATGFDLTVQNLTVPNGGSANIPGIALTTNDAVFPNLLVTGFSTFQGDVEADSNVSIAGTVFVGADGSPVITIDPSQRLVQVGDSFIQGSNFATLTPAKIKSGEAEFTQLNVTGSTNSVFAGDVEVQGDLIVSGDIEYDEVTGRNLEITGIGTIKDLFSENLTVSELTELKDLNVSGVANIDGVGIVTEGGDVTFNTIRVTGFSTFVGVGTFQNDLFVSDDLFVSGLTSTTNLIASGVSTLNVLGVSSIGFGTATGDEITTNSLTVPPGGFVSLPGIPVSGGSATFSELEVTGVSTFAGIATFSADIYVNGDLVVEGNQVFSGISGVNIDVTGILTTNQFRATGLSTFTSDLFVEDDLFVKRNLLVGGIATVGTLTATDARFQNVIIDGNLTGGSDGQAIIIDGDSIISGIVTIGPASITLNGLPGQEKIEIGTGSGNVIAGLNTFTNEPSHVQVDEGRFNTFISVAGVGSTSTFSNDLTVGGNLKADSADITGTISAEDFNSLSDIRVKENVKPIDGALDKICKLNGITFDFINSGKQSAGVIAQEVQKVFPTMVVGDFPKSVNYNGLIGALIESVKELKEENIELRTRIEKLES